MGKYRPGATDKDKDALLRAVRSMWKDSAAILPEGMAIEWLEVKSTGTTTRQQDFVDWVDTQLSKLVLGQTGTTDVGQHVGTAKAHEHVNRIQRATSSAPERPRAPVTGDIRGNSSSSPSAPARAHPPADF